MIKKIKVKNYKCIEQIELDFSMGSTALLIGKNAVGKSVIGDVLSVFQAIAQQKIHTGELIHKRDFLFGDVSATVSLEIEVKMDGALYRYMISFEWPDGFHNARVKHEALWSADEEIFSRERADMTYEQRTFGVNWHFAALSMLNAAPDTPVDRFRAWLARLVILAPIPSIMSGVYTKESAGLSRDTSNFADWLVSSLTHFPVAYQELDGFLSDIFDDFKYFEFRPSGDSSKKIIVHFEVGGKRWTVDFETMSSGEKCIILGAALIAVHKTNGPLACFWDEPDNHLSLGEIDHLILHLRRSFHYQGFLLLASHKQNVIESFSAENTFVLDRENHLTTTKVSLLENTPFKNHVIDSMILGDISL